MAHRPSVSLVMATRDKREYLALTLESLLAQTASRFEVVLCDDGTRGGVADVVAPFADRLDLELVVQEPRGRAAARNAALERAQGDLIVFVDDDRLAAPGFVAAHADAADGGGAIGWKRRAVTWWRPGVLPVGEADLMRLAFRAGGLAGLRKPRWMINPGELEADAEDALARVDLGEERDNHREVVDAFRPGLEGFRFGWGLATTANLAVPREAVLEAGGFDESFTGWGMEDTDLSYRLHRLGLRFSVCAAAVNYHQVHPLVDPDPVAAERIMKAQLMANLAYFCERHRSLEAHLFRGFWAGATTLAEADALLRRAEADPMLRHELETFYMSR
jgi:glycosyltransferase involved in cell wall biosynthesis